jgi:hypothetical protein
MNNNYANFNNKAKKFIKIKIKIYKTWHHLSNHFLSLFFFPANCLLKQGGTSFNYGGGGGYRFLQTNRRLF